MAALKKKARKQSKTMLPPKPLGQEAKRVLSSVFKAAESEMGGVDVATYRVKHKKQWDMLEALERDGFLRKDTGSNKFFVSLIGLAQLGAKRAKRLLANSEKIFAELRKCYTADPHAKVYLAELEARTGLAVGNIKESLDYMTEMSIWSGHNLSGDKVDVADMYVLPSENVVSPKYRRFRDLIVERLRWTEDRKTRPQYQTPDGFFGGLAKTDKSRKKVAAEARSTDQRGWYRSLKPGLRSLMAEVSMAIDADTRTLAAMGLRAVVDMACNDVLGDIGGFDKKLTALQDSERITGAQKRTLANALELGHASAHRGHIPTKKGIALLRDIVEHLLKQLYLHESASEELRRGVPGRERVSTKGYKV